MAELALETKLLTSADNHCWLRADCSLSKAYHIKSRLIQSFVHRLFAHWSSMPFTYVPLTHPRLPTCPTHSGQLALPQICLMLPCHHIFAVDISSCSSALSNPKFPLKYTLKTREFYSGVCVCMCAYTHMCVC